MLKPFIFAVSFFVLLAVGFTYAVSQQTPPASSCGDRMAMTNTLVSKYGENQLHVGMSKGLIYEVWGNEETGTFSILKTFPNGIACVVVVGTSWVSLPPSIPGVPS